jgi:hypothetical protein
VKPLLMYLDDGFASHVQSMLAIGVGVNPEDVAT